MESQPVSDAHVEEQSPAASTRIFDLAAPDTEPRDELAWGAVVKASGELVGAVERAVTGTGADFVSLFHARPRSRINRQFCSHN